MYEAKKDQIEQLRRRFESAIEARSPEAREVGSDYLDSLTDFVRTYNDGPAGDPRTAGLDTTGQIARVEEHASWAERERHRVRKALNDIV